LPHGEGRDRGQTLVDLKRLSERAGRELSSRELPDTRFARRQPALSFLATQ
jgi:hypothetical protein